MGQTTVNVRVDVDVKRRMEKFCGAVGMNLSTAINLYFMAVLNQRKIPFEIAEPDLSLEAAIQDSLTRQNLYGPFDTAEQAVASMLEE